MGRLAMKEATGSANAVKVKIEPVEVKIEPSERYSAAPPSISRGKVMKQKKEKVKKVGGKQKKETVKKVVKNERKSPRTVTRKKLKKLKSFKATPRKQGVVRPPHKERAWQAVQSAPFVAEKLRREAPNPV